MSLNSQKIFALFLSIIFHIIFIGGFFYLQIHSEESAKWSGGRGDGTESVTYVDLGSFDVLTGKETKTSKTESIPKTKAELKIKTKKKIKKKPKVTKKKVGGKKDSGIGDSDTPAGGIGSGLDPDGVISKTAPNTLALIRKRIMRQKRYPVVAKENKWTGNVKVSFKINEGGGLDFVKVLSSSGHQVLDDSAIKTVQKAAPLPFYPKVIALSLEYRLK